MCDKRLYASDLGNSRDVNVSLSLSVGEATC